MKKKFISILVMISIFLTLTSSVYAGGFALSGIGARALGLGGAYRGVANDYTAMYWNPAGLCFANSSVAISLSNIMPKGDYKTDFTQVEVPGINTGKVNSEDKSFLMPNLFITKGNSDLSYGIGAYVTYGLGSEWDFFNLPNTQIIPSAGVAVPITWSEGFPKIDIMSNLNILDIHPTIAYKVMPNLSIGAGLSIMRGKIDIRKLMPHIQYKTYLPTVFELEGTGWGYGANMGILFKASDDFQIGLSGKMPSTIKLEGDAKMKVFVNSFFASQDGNTQSNAPYTAESKPKAKADLNLPGDLGIGMSYKVLKNLMLTGDFAMTFWDRFDKVIIDYDGKTPNLVYLGRPEVELTQDTLRTEWENTKRFSFGAEYKFNQLPLSLRTGFFYDESPIPDETLDPTWADIGTKSSFNFGCGYDFRNLSLNMVYEYIIFAKRKIDNQNYTTKGGFENMKGNYNVNISNINVSLEYKF